MPKPKHTKKAVAVPDVPQGVQVHFGNAKIIELRLLEQIVKNTAEIVKLLNKVNEA